MGCRMVGVFGVQIIADLRSYAKMRGEWSSTSTAERCGIVSDLWKA
jgi:hypothetical protein